jgi:hypothetical protein
MQFMTAAGLWWVKPSHGRVWLAMLRNLSNHSSSNVLSPLIEKWVTHFITTSGLEWYLYISLLSSWIFSIVSSDRVPWLFRRGWGWDVDDSDSGVDIDWNGVSCCSTLGRKFPIESADIACRNLWMHFLLGLRYKDGRLGWYLPEFLPARYSIKPTISPLPLCIVRLCLVALYLLVKCSSQVPHTYVGLPIYVYIG